MRNIRSAQTPPQIIRAAEGAGWVVKIQEVVTPGPKQRDGLREVSMVLESKFKANLEAVQVERVKAMLYGMVNAVAASVDLLDGGVEAARTMDVWVARFDMRNEKISR